MDAGDLEKALQTLQPALSSAPDNVVVGNLYALILSRLGRFREASSILEAFPQSDDADWLRLRGHVLSALGHHKIAVEALEASLKLAPDSSATYYVLGRTHIAMAPNGLFSKDKLHNSGLDYLRKAISLDPNTINARTALAWELLGVRNSQAEQLSRECLELNLEDPASRTLAAEIALQKGDVEAALAHSQFLFGFPLMQRQATSFMRRAKIAQWRPLRIWKKFTWASGYHPLTSWLPFSPLIGLTIYLCEHFEARGSGIYAVGGLVFISYILVLVMLGYLEDRAVQPIELKYDY